MRTETMQCQIARISNAALDRSPEGLRGDVENFSRHSIRDMIERAPKLSGVDDVTLAKLMVRGGYALAAMAGADLDLLIRQDLAREEEARVAGA